MALAAVVGRIEASLAIHGTHGCVNYGAVPDVIQF
jgi:hypothetical protein